MRTASVALTTLIVACGHAERDAAWASRAAGLAGQWTVRFEASQAIAPAHPAEVTGTMTLTVNESVDRSLADVGLPTNYGIYEIDFRPLGFAPSGGRVPGVFAGVTDGDTLQIDFESDRRGFIMRMRAPLGRDSLRGTWSASESRNPLGAGTFLMTRR